MTKNLFKMAKFSKDGVLSKVLVKDKISKTANENLAFLLSLSGKE